MHMAMLQTRMTPLGQGLPSPATLLFICLAIHVMDRQPMNKDNDDEYHQTLMHRQGKNDRGNNTSKIFISIPTGSTVVVQQEDGGHGPMVQ